jgi:uncharacterized protein YndB with AHSA1/START domain
MGHARGGTDVVEHEVRIEAPPEEVFAYFTDPVKLVRWLGREATLDPRPGGVCSIRITSSIVMRGEFVEVVPFSKVVFLWGWESGMFSMDSSSTLVEVHLTREDDATRVRLIHRRLPSDAAREFHRLGWSHFLGRVAIAATGADPGPDPWSGRADPRSIDSPQ